MPALASDDFNGADGGLGSNYNAYRSLFDTAAVLVISANKVIGDAGGELPVSEHVATLENDQYAKAIISSTGGGSAGLFVRGSGDAGTILTGYIVLANIVAETCSLRHYTAGVLTTELATNFTTYANGDEIEIQAEGTTIRVLKNGTVVTSQTDSALSSGKAGLSVQNNAVSLDNLEIGNMANPPSGGAKLLIRNVNYV